MTTRLVVSVCGQVAAFHGSLGNYGNLLMTKVITRRSPLPPNPPCDCPEFCQLFEEYTGHPPSLWLGSLTSLQACITGAFTINLTLTSISSNHLPVCQWVHIFPYQWLLDVDLLFPLWCLTDLKFQKPCDKHYIGKQVWTYTQIGTNTIYTPLTLHFTNEILHFVRQKTPV